VTPANLITWPATLINRATTTTDAYGDVVTGTEVLTAVMVGAEPGNGLGASTEDTANAQISALTWTVYALPTVDLRATSRLILEDGPTLELTGPPLSYRHPRHRSMTFIQAPAKVVK
jgi:hypothetical protein